MAEKHAVKRVLLVNPSWALVYRDTKVKEAVPIHPVLTLAALAGELIRAGHEVRILDFNLPRTTKNDLLCQIEMWKPHYVGTTFTTPLVPMASMIYKEVKKMDCSIITLAGGPHATALPKITLEEIPELDILVIGEADITLPRIIDGTPLQKIEGIVYRKNGRIIETPYHVNYIEDLDILAYPAWHLFDIKRYKTSRLISKKDPVGCIETSRGCVFGCCYCNKLVHGRTFRVKSVKRVVDEMEYMLNLGFKEIYVVDDGFSTDIKRAEEICLEIIRRRLIFPWTLTSGIRVDKSSRNLFKLLKKAGCYRVAFGIESGNQKVLDGFGKGIRLEQVKPAISWANKEGLETWGYFIIGLPNDTEKTIKETIRFSTTLDLYTAKFSILIPFPGSPIYNQWDKMGLIKNKCWGDYNMYNPQILYDHPHLKWNTLVEYNQLAFRKFYLRPKYIFQRAWHDFFTGMIYYDIATFFKTKW